MRLLRSVLAGVLLVAAWAPAALAQGLLRDEEIERMLRSFGDPIFEAANLNPKDVHIYLLGDPTMNAFVSGGQNIFIHTGIIVNADAPIELKGVMAHETGHIVGAHLARSGEMNRAAMGPFLATMAAGIAAAAAGHGDAAAGLLMSSEYFATLGAFTYSRGQESNADLAGVSFLEKSHQSARGLVAFFDRFRGQELATGENLYPYFRTHPLSSDRISILRDRLEHQQYKDVVDPEDQQLALERAKAKIYGFLDTPATTFRRFPESEQHTEAIYARSIAHYRAGSLGKALEGMDELLRREPNNPYFWELKGQMLYEHGQPDRAVDPYEHAVKILPDSALFKIGLAQALIDAADKGTGRLAPADAPKLDEAMRNLKASLVLESDNALAWYNISRIYELQGDHTMSLLAAAERFYYSGDQVRAAQFAQRARQDLQQGTPDWIRASDIVSTVRDSMPDDRRRRQ